MQTVNEIGEIYRIRRDTKQSSGSIRREYWTGHFWGSKGALYSLGDLRQALKCHEHGASFNVGENVSIQIELFSVKLHKTVSFDEVR